MAFTKEMIFNITLNNLGVSAIVQNTVEVTPRITVLNNNYNLALEQVMKDFNWNFLHRIKELTLVSEKSPNPKFLYAFDYPNDCISARYVLDKAGEYKKFDISTDSKGNKIILCNINPALLEYTRKLSAQIPETFFTSEFVNALCFYLAYLCSDSITGRDNKKQSLFQSYQLAILKAKQMNASESSKYDEDDRTYIDYRN